MSPLTPQATTLHHLAELMPHLKYVVVSRYSTLSYFGALTPEQSIKSRLTEYSSTKSLYASHRVLRKIIRRKRVFPGATLRRLGLAGSGTNGASVK